jgi:hypothetical protein
MRLRHIAPYIRYRIGLRPEPGAYLISYPKTGRTWLRTLLGKALCDAYGLPEHRFLDTALVTYLAGLPRTHFTHDEGALGQAIACEKLSADKSQYRHAKVVLLSREVKDTLVSSYFQASKRKATDRFEGTMSEFIRSDLYGARKVLMFYRHWYAARQTPKDLLFITYEQMRQDTGKVLAGVLAFLGAREIDPAIIRGAVEFASFDNMKKMEASGAVKGAALRPSDAKDPQSFKVREGKVGGYSRYLTPEDIAYIDAQAEELGCPFTQGLQASQTA